MTNQWLYDAFKDYEEKRLSRYNFCQLIISRTAIPPCEKHFWNKRSKNYRVCIKCHFIEDFGKPPEEEVNG